MHRRSAAGFKYGAIGEMNAKFKNSAVHVNVTAVAAIAATTTFVCVPSNLRV